ncbi:MAG: site-specific DNA-methyltransferase [Proteobacteria bacterium]|nr:site-specific DNA-methyltransferase [Pseudomonadota bacterium]
MTNTFEKLDLQTPDYTNENIAKLAELFPNCVTEKRNDKGELERAIDFDALRQEFSSSVVEGSAERYSLNWPGKRKALVAANTPINKTLRPCRKESVDFPKTKNIFIEGDNLDALKLLQETYLGKIKMIYIDPPYNTGNDFIYNDSFTADKQEYDEASQQKDGDGGRLVANQESNGRFHSDWLSMVYPRLKLARNLLRDDGLIFISIDDNEQANLKRLCDEVFGEDNFIGNIIWEKRYGRSNNAKLMTNSTEHIILYRKSSAIEILREVRSVNHNEGYSNPDNDKRGVWTSVSFVNQVTCDARPNLTYTIKNPNTGEEINHPTNAWKVSQEKYKTFLEENRLHWGADGKAKYPRIKRFLSELDDGMVPVNFWKFKEAGTVDMGTKEVKALMDIDAFTFPKPPLLIKKMLSLFTPSETIKPKEDIVLDFFAGSGTTAHAVMQLNAEDGGNRKCISVQLPEATDEKSEAFKAGYKNIAEISKERIRRAGKKIKEDNAGKEGIENLDVGFRVFKIDSSNMEDVHLTPDETRLELFDALEGNIKKDRTPEDLLFQVLLDWGVDLSLPIECNNIDGKQVFFVDDNALAACFEEGINEDFVKQLAERQPLRVVFRDDGFANDAVKINIEQIFKLKSPATDIKVI